MTRVGLQGHSKKKKNIYIYIFVYIYIYMKNNFSAHLECTSILLSCSVASFKVQYTSIRGGKEDCVVSRMF